jgi:capsular polysaccharide biosynthesis protein
LVTVEDPVHRGDVPPPVDLAGHLREFARALVPALVVALIVGGLVFVTRTMFADKEYAANLVTEITPSGELVPGDAFVEQMRAPFMGLAQDTTVLDQVLSEVDTDWDAQTLSEHVELSKGPAPQILIFTATAGSPELAEQIARSMVVTVSQAAFANHSREISAQLDQIQASIGAEEARNATLLPEDPARPESDRQLAELRGQLETLQNSGGDTLTLLASPAQDTSPVSPQPVSEGLVAGVVTLIVVAELIVAWRSRIGKKPNRTWARRVARRYGAHFDPSTVPAGELDPLTSAKLVQAIRDGRPALLLVGEHAAAPPSLTSARDADRGRFRTLFDAPLSSPWWQRVNAGAAGTAVVVVSVTGTDRAAAERALRQLADLRVPRNLVLQRAVRHDRRHAKPAPEPSPTENTELNQANHHDR